MARGKRPILTPQTLESSKQEDELGKHSDVISPVE